MIDPAVKLARMANQIASFFRSRPPEEGAKGVRDHLVAFWAPRMRRDLTAALDRPGIDLDPLVVAALRDMPPA